MKKSETKQEDLVETPTPDVPTPEGEAPKRVPTFYPRSGETLLQ